MFVWTILASAPNPASYYYAEGAMVGLNGKLYVVGYRLDADNPMGIYDIASNTWQTPSIDLTALPTGSQDAGMVVGPDQTIWFYFYSRSVASCFINFDPTTLTFSTPQFISPDLQFSSEYPSSLVIVGEDIYLNGSFNANRFLKFNTRTFAMTLTSESTHYTSYRPICTNGTIIYSVEGYRGNWSDIGLDPPGQYDTGVIEFYDIATDTWSHSPNTDPHFRNDNGAVFGNGRIYSIGGGSDDDLGPDGYAVPWISSYDPTSDTWTVEGELDQSRSEPSVVVYNDILYVFSGDGNSNNPNESLISTPMSGGGASHTSLPFEDNFNRSNGPLGFPWVSLTDDPDRPVLGVVDDMAGIAPITVTTFTDWIDPSSVTFTKVNREPQSDSGFPSVRERSDSYRIEDTNTGAYGWSWTAPPTLQHPPDECSASGNFSFVVGQGFDAGLESHPTIAIEALPVTATTANMSMWTIASGVTLTSGTTYSLPDLGFQACMIWVRSDSPESNGLYLQWGSATYAQDMESPTIGVFSWSNTYPSRPSRLDWGQSGQERYDTGPDSQPSSAYELEHQYIPDYTYPDLQAAPRYVPPNSDWPTGAVGYEYEFDEIVENRIDWIQHVSLSCDVLANLASDEQFAGGNVHEWHHLPMHVQLILAEGSHAVDNASDAHTIPASDIVNHSITLWSTTLSPSVNTDGTYPTAGNSVRVYADDAGNITAYANQLTSNAITMLDVVQSGGMDFYLNYYSGLPTGQAVFKGTYAGSISGTTINNIYSRMSDYTLVSSANGDPMVFQKTTDETFNIVDLDITSAYKQAVTLGYDTYYLVFSEQTQSTPLWLAAATPIPPPLISIYPAELMSRVYGATARFGYDASVANPNQGILRTSLTYKPTRYRYRLLTTSPAPPGTAYSYVDPGTGDVVLTVTV